MPVPGDAQLSLLLEAPRATSDARWLERLLLWLKAASPEGGAASPRTARLRELGRSIEAHPNAEGLRLRIAQAWGHASAIRLLAETGLPERSTFLGEGFQRVVDSAVPRLDAEEDLFALLARLDPQEADADWVAALPADLAAYWGPLLAPAPELWVHAARLLAHRAAAVGLSRDLLELDPEGSDADSPFFLLPRTVRGWGERPGDPEQQAAWDTCRAACREELATALERLDERGVSTDLVYRLELLDAQLVRIDTLLHAAAGREDRLAFAAQLVRGSARRRSLRDLLRGATKRLARKIVEHTGETGEHYVVKDRRDWRVIGWAAAGAGLLTVGTALAKYGLNALPLAPLVLGLGLALNYAVSFILMQLGGLTLASKQPAMTASALAGALERENGLEEEVELVAAITRSQVAATLGNVLAAIPGSILVCWAFAALAKHPLLSAATARHGLEALHPYKSLSFLYAAITGVFLWLQSLAAGWAGNWSAYRRLPEALARSPRLNALLGEEGAARAGAFVRRHLSGIVGYVALGFLLGFVPVLVSSFVGVRLEVRHVTLQAASWALDAASLWGTKDFPWGAALWGLSSIGVIGAFNFGVSFWLALRTALRARDLDAAGRRELTRRLLRELNEHPRRFFWAPR